MGGISLTASMRSNLLSLQNISGQVSSTQNKLATGNKVNSAIDNPSSYYTALSLNNRADDLNALLDSMSQAVSTIKAATTALESATEFLEQAKAVANQALEQAIPSKEQLQNMVGENGAIVSTAQELRDAIAAGKETICVYSAIDLGDISQTGGLELKENQKLVGVGYFGNYDTDINKFSSITATAKTAKNLISITKNGCEVSDLSVNYTNEVTSGGTSAIYVTGQSGKQYQSSLHNLDVNANFSNDNAQEKSAISIVAELQTSITGKINIQSQGRTTYGIYISNRGTLDIRNGSQINIKTNGRSGIGINSSNATVNISDGVGMNIQNIGELGKGIISGVGSIININEDADIRIKSQAYGLWAESGGTFNIDGKLYLNVGHDAIRNNKWGAGSTININSSAQIYAIGTILNGADYGQGANIMNIAAGAKLAFEKDGKTDWYEVKEKYHDENTSNTIDNKITADDVKDKLNLETTSAWDLPEKVEIDFEDSNSSDETAKQDLSGDSKQYQEIINQYDSLIKDAGYKGINLLQPERLTVKFNEDNTAALEVQGKDMSSKALGFTIFEWQTQGDINASIEELTSAINSIRNYSSELGNNYNIITTRQDFTESLVNVLTEGADKLTLADMNEESANMLALQTRQQLAINSLSLASQASQSILKLF